MKFSWYFDIKECDVALKQSSELIVHCERSSVEIMEPHNEWPWRNNHNHNNNFNLTLAITVIKVIKVT